MGGGGGLQVYIYIHKGDGKWQFLTLSNEEGKNLRQVL